MDPQSARPSIMTRHCIALFASVGPWRIDGIWSLLVFGLLCGSLPCLADDSGAPSQTEKQPLRVRIDAYHAHTWIETLPRPGLTDYHLLYGPARAVAALEATGFESETQIGPWTEADLRETDLVIINLPSADRPPFLVSEIEALMNYLREGGGVVFITDHTNCYFHNHVLGALFRELGMQLTSDLVCERSPLAMPNGNAWINIESFSDHPVVRGLRNVGYLSGGSVDERFAIAWSSPKSWADEARIPAYGEGVAHGFFGDFKQQPAERVGPLAVIAAKEIVQGRVVVIADQNCIGGAFLNYADNRQLWLQSCLWSISSQQNRLQEAEFLQRGLAAEKDRTLIWCLEPLRDHEYYWSSSKDDALFNAFVFLNKHADARGTDRPLLEATWIIVPDVKLLGIARWREMVRDFAEQPDRHVLVLGEEAGEGAMAAWSEWVGARAGERASPAIDTTYRMPSGSQVHWTVRRSDWTNRSMPGPSAARNEGDEREDNAKLQWMHDLGLRRVPSANEQVPWPVD